MQKKKSWWQYSLSDLCQHLHTDSKQGLTTPQVIEYQKKYGFSELPEQKKISPIELFLSQFSSFIVWILIGALIISGILGEWGNALSIGVIILLNAIIGFFQEYHAEKSLAALKKLTKPNSHVIRDGNIATIPSNHIVPGDLVVLEAGDLVPADGRIIYSAQLATQEAALTGESVPIEKITATLTAQNLSLGDRTNMAFMGTIVVHGKGHMLVTETALHTELGHIATLLQTETSNQTPLQKKIEAFGQQLVYFCLGIVLIVFTLGMLRHHAFIDIFLTAVSLAVAAIPEGLPAIMTIALAMGVRKMAKRKALIRRLASVETLGCTTVICTDKTGTLTQNEMTVRKLWVNEKFIDVTGTGYTPIGTFEINQTPINAQENNELMLALKIGVLCNGATLHEKNSLWHIIGDPTEGALLTTAAKAKLEKSTLESEFPLVAEIPFDSERKRMSIVRTTPSGRTMFVKGAPDGVLSHSEKICIDGNILPLTDDHKKHIIEANNQLGKQTLRVLALAYREIEPQETIDNNRENNLIFVGLVAMMDPPRPEAKHAILTCKKAGIRTIMITGDHKETAIAIAHELGLMEDGLLAISGAELDQISDEALQSKIKQIVVYARVSAEHKIRIVKAWKTQGEVVAMTGDGVNDAPAIKAADIGIAMGITGTEVTKEASDMVITDDNFASIVSAVEEGRGIYDNIIKFISYLVSSNIAELLIIFISALMGFTDLQGNPYIALLPIQLLWINLVTDGLPAIALGMDPIDPHVMHRSPRKASTSLISKHTALQLFSISCIITLATLTACHFGRRTSVTLAHSMAFTALVVFELTKCLMIRARYNIGFFSNPWIIAALISSLFLQLAVIYIPSLQKIFKTVALGIIEWSVIIVLTFLVWLSGTLVESTLQRINQPKANQ